jgi:UDP-hydrolysing UDP-N-acetyl-D-glucosamine 2-epimerase
MRVKVALVTTNRSDYGLVYWLIHDLTADARFELALVVGGAHLSEAHGRTVTEIEADGWPIHTRLPFLEGPLSAETLGPSAARALNGFSDFLRAYRPDVVVLTADRWELLPLSTAATLAAVPIVHLFGGDITAGAIDDQVRHAVTKLAHVHVPASAGSAARIRQLGEEPWRIHFVGDPGLDQFVRGRAASREELASFFGFAPGATTLLVTFHPTTVLAPAAIRHEVSELVAALGRHAGPVVVTAPAADPGEDIVRDALERFASGRRDTVFVESLGGVRYRGLMRVAGAVVGNSSSGIVEAPCVPVPSVNIGDRQAGRERSPSVLDVPAERGAIAGAIDRALSSAFRAALSAPASADGRASTRVVDALATLPSRERLLAKRFVQLSAAGDPSPVVPAIGGGFAIEPASLLGGAGTRFATGRDALSAILAAEGPAVRRWLVPAFICPAVPDAIRARGATPIPYPWTSPWRADASALARLIDGADAIVVPYHLGCPPDEAIWGLLAGSALRIVEDRCQCVEAAPAAATLRGHYAIGSYRKWLPVTDGAYGVSRVGRALAPSGPPNAALAAAQLAAGLARGLRDARSPGRAAAEALAVQWYAEGESAAGDGRHTHRSTAAADRVIAAADVEGIRRARLANQRSLIERLAGAHSVRVLEDSRAHEIPLLALPVVCVDREDTRRRLADARIFCAVHWADGDWSGSGGAAREWAETLLSVPIDQRYAPADLARIAESL